MKWLIAAGASSAVVALVGVVIVRAPWSAPAPVVAPSAAEMRDVETEHRAALARLPTPARHGAQAPNAALRIAGLVRDLEAALVSVDDRDRDRALTESLPQLMAIAPSVAARVLERTPRGFSHDGLRDRMARLWATADLDGALEWVTTLEDDDDRRLATTEIRSRIAASDPATAIEISDLMDLGRDDGALAHLAQLWAEEDPSAALAWAQRQPASPLRDQLLARIALVRTRSRPIPTR